MQSVQILPIIISQKMYISFNIWRKMEHFIYLLSHLYMVMNWAQIVHFFSITQPKS